MWPCDLSDKCDVFQLRFCGQTLEKVGTVCERVTACVCLCGLLSEIKDGYLEIPLNCIVLCAYSFLRRYLSMMWSG